MTIENLNYPHVKKIVRNFENSSKHHDFLNVKLELKNRRLQKSSLLFFPYFQELKKQISPSLMSVLVEFFFFNNSYV